MGVRCGACGAECMERFVVWDCPRCGESGTVQHHRHVRNNRREALVLALLAGGKAVEMHPPEVMRETDRYLAALDERHQQEDGA